MTVEDEVALLGRQLERERLARQTAEEIGERATLELYELTVSLRRANEQLEAAKGRIGTLAQEPWFRTTLWSLGDAVIATDAEARVRFMNPVATTLTGWPLDEAEGRPIDEVFRTIGEETRAPVQSPVAAVLRDGVVLGLAEHSVLVGRDGREYSIDDSAAPIVRGGRNDGVVLVFRDVTTSRRELRRRRFLTEATGILASSLEREESLERLCALAVLHYATWCVVYTKRDGHLAIEAVGHDDVTQRPRLREEQPALALANRVVATRTPELVPAGPDGPTQIAAPIADHADVLGALVLSSDGEAYSAEDLELAGELATRVGIALRHARLYEESVHANRFKDELLAGLSYELRTPLTAILGWLQICKRDPGNVELVRKTLDIAERNARAEAELIADLLDVSDVLAGEVELHPERLDASDFARGAVEATRPAAEAKGVVLAFEGGPPCVVDADPQRLHQVLSNLVGNALTYTPTGGRVEVSTLCDEGGARFVVRDTGAGIAPAFLPHVFDAFRKWDPSTRPRPAGRGLGIGLAIARRLVELHGGRITASSEGTRRGATFEVVLPAPTGPGKVTPSRAGAPRLDGTRVLVVDDHLDSRDLVAELLAEVGAAVETAGSVEEALGRLRESPVDVILTDIAMPVLDGYDLLARVRETSPVPVIALTALAGEAEARRLREHGFARHIKKPVDTDALVAAVAECARGVASG